MTMTGELPDVEGDIRRAIESEIRSLPVRSNWASKLGHPCERHAVHNRLDWDKKEKHSVTTEMIFQGGHVLEKHVALVYLQKAGYKIVEADRPIDTESSGTLKRLEIGGRLDFVIRKEPQPGDSYDPKKPRRDEFPVEVKSMNSYDWEKMNSIEDMTLSKKVWQRAYPAQIMLYMIAKEYETGLFLLINKQTYEPKVIWVQLDWQYVEDLLKKAERINAHAKAGTYPDRIPYDDKICGRCEFANICLKDVVRDEAAILTDEQLLSDLEERESIKKMAKRFDELDKDVKRRLKEVGEKALAGEFLIFNKKQHRNGYTVEPADMTVTSIKKMGEPK